MSTRAFNQPCADANAREAEWQAMPKELRDFLRPPGIAPVASRHSSELTVQHIKEPCFEVVAFPAFTFLAAVGDAQQFVHIDAALLLSVYRQHGGIMAVYRFVLCEASAALEGLSLFIKENAATTVPA